MVPAAAREAQRVGCHLKGKRQIIGTPVGTCHEDAWCTAVLKREARMNLDIECILSEGDDPGDFLFCALHFVPPAIMDVQ